MTDQEKAEAIARGEHHFETETTVAVVPGPVVNRMLFVGFVVMGAITAVAVVALLVFSIYRGQERHSFNQTLAEVSDELHVAQAQRDQFKKALDETNAGIQCRAESQLDLDRAQAATQLVIAQQFASAIDQVPPPPDANVVSQSAAALQKALDARADALNRCGP